jgi:hypothetical protein
MLSIIVITGSNQSDTYWKRMKKEFDVRKIVHKDYIVMQRLYQPGGASYKKW